MGYLVVIVVWEYLEGGPGPGTYNDVADWLFSNSRHINTDHCDILLLTCCCYSLQLLIIRHITIIAIGPRLSKSQLSEASVIRTLFRIFKSQNTI